MNKNSSNDSGFVIYGENLKALYSISERFKNKVKCVYIDPPYNVNMLSTHFNDNMIHSEWLNMMRERLVILHQLLKEDGTIWISINDGECHYLKILCDEIFGKANFLMTIIWEKADVKDNLTPYICESHDYILCYAKNRKACEPELRKKFKFRTIWKKEEVGDTFEALDEVEKFNTVDVFPTPKPERLLYRIIEIATNPEDLVLDCFGGSGTTAAVAHKMGRKWIVIEQGQQCQNHILPRIKAIIAGSDQGGVSSTCDWRGGGEYEYLEIS